MIDKLKRFQNGHVLLVITLTGGDQRIFLLKIGTDYKIGGHNNKGLQKRRVVVN